MNARETNRKTKIGCRERKNENERTWPCQGQKNGKEKCRPPHEKCNPLTPTRSFVVSSGNCREILDVVLFL